MDERPEDEEVQLHIQIQIEASLFPTPGEMDARHRLEDMLEARGIGFVTGAGGGMGTADVWVVVQDVPSAKQAIQALLQELGLENTAIIEVVDSD